MRVRAASLAACLVIVFAISLEARTCGAQTDTSRRLRKTVEIAPFRLTGIDGYLVTRYLSDDSRSPALMGGAGSRAKQSSLSEELFVMTHSYIYHPTLLSLDLGGGPVIDRGSYATEAGATSSGKQAFNLSGRARILHEKPYTGVMFYDRRNDAMSMGPAQQMVTESTRYGASFSLLNPATPIPMQVDITHSEEQGSGVEQAVNDRSDQLRMKLEANLNQLSGSLLQGASTFQFENTHRVSASGSVGLPIQANSSRSERMNLDTRLKFGARNEYDLSNTITTHTSEFTTGQRLPAPQKDFSFGVNLIGRHSDELQTYWNYNHNTNRQGDLAMTLDSVSSGISYSLTPELSGRFTARGESSKSSHVSASSYGLDGSAQYRHALPLGQATASYNFAYNVRDQRATALEDKIYGEHVTLTGTVLATLSQEQVIAATVVVSNPSRTQIFVEGSDYVLSSLGLRLRIQRVIGGNILDGQEVLIDYAYATGGTYARNQFDNAINLGWAYKSYLSVYLRYMDSTPHLTSGSPTAMLNPAKSTLLGARAELPLSLLSREFRLGGNVEGENRREIISPYKRTSLDAYMQTDVPLVSSGNLRIGVRNLKTDYDYNPEQAIKLVAWDMRLGARLGYGINLTAEANRTRDTGGTTVRESSSTSVRAGWRRRKLQASFELTHVREAQGSVERTRIYGQFVLRRDF